MKDKLNPTFQELIDFFKQFPEIKKIENKFTIMLDFQWSIKNDEIYYLSIKNKGYTNEQMRNDDHLREKKSFLIMVFNEWENTEKELY